MGLHNRGGEPSSAVGRRDTAAAVKSTFPQLSGVCSRAAEEAEPDDDTDEQEESEAEPIHDAETTPAQPKDNPHTQQHC